MESMTFPCPKSIPVTCACEIYSQFLISPSFSATWLIRWISPQESQIAWYSASLSQCPCASERIQRGIFTLISLIGNSISTLDRMWRISVSVRSRQFTARTGTPYFSCICSANSLDWAVFGCAQLSNTANGFSSSWSSRITLSSASSYSSLGMSLIEPSEVTTSPMVECSWMTFCVPISAAMLNGISWSNHGVMTMRGCSFST